MPLIGVFTPGVCGEEDWFTKHNANAVHVNELMLIIQEEAPRNEWINIHDVFYCESGLRPYPYINPLARGDNGYSWGGAQIQPRYWKDYIHEGESLFNLRDAVRITTRIITDEERPWQKRWNPWACRPGSSKVKAAKKQLLKGI